MGGRPGVPRALAVPTGPLGSAGPPQTAETIFSCILERLTENWLLTQKGNTQAECATCASAIAAGAVVCGV